MSSVTDVVVYVPFLIADDEADLHDRRLHEYLISPIRGDDGDPQHLAKLDESMAGGHKSFTGAVYAAGFNYVSVDYVVPFLEAAPWGDETPVAVIMHEQDDTPTIWILQT